MIAFDTSSQACSVALLDGDKVNVLHRIAPKQHSQVILPMINELLHSSHLTFEDLHAIAYGCGPGRFTGIRIASCVAQGIGFAKSLPIIPVSSLAAIAEATYLEHKASKVLIAVDARMNQVYWGRYVLNPQGYMELMDKEYLTSPEDIDFPLESGWTLAGDGFSEYHETMMSKWKDKALFPSIYPINPTALALVRLAKIKWDKKQWVPASCALPIYLH